MTDCAQLFDEIVFKRRSLRAFLPREVEADELQRIFAVAQRAPSNCNTQPWLTHVASGAALQALREELPKRFMAGEISLDFPYDGVYQGVYRERQYGSAQALYDSVGIAREDKAARHRQFMRNFTFFDAPHVAFLFLPEPFGLREAADLGMYAQTLMLAMTAHGLGSCPQTALGFQADTIRAGLGIDATNKLLFGISFGYPDPAAPANSCSTDRAGVPDAVKFHSAPPVSAT
ncbi:MAG: nitroreductase [Pseudomonadales bacterium]|nr:nitroreductase [Halieaceae bacterium]MCP5164293.1 nitroreductase [Pseudomonadales bacterium]MCP5189884.1 nitroreductase [Pseudomonadales bacterium]MCP5203608.1 nitroreductase [Pseudomonadales bacterium]